MDSIEGAVFDRADREISSSQIGEIVMEHLQHLDRWLTSASRLFTGNLKMSALSWMS